MSKLRSARVAPEKAVFRPALPLRSSPGLIGTAMKIGAIETEYAGHAFRSRLEARWAVFFDHIGAVWKYETQGFVHGKHKYLPDFFLPEIGVWVEVKGDPEGVRLRFECMCAMLGADSPLPNIAFSYPESDEAASFTGGLLLLGEIPVCGKGMVFHPLLSHSKKYGIRRDWFAFIRRTKAPETSMMRAGDGVVAYLSGLMPEKNLENSSADEGWRVESVVLEKPLHFPEISRAYEAARQARFEHGKKGAR